MSAELIELSNALAQSTERAAASVVAVHAEARGSASGVVWRTGIIVTAEHAFAATKKFTRPCRMPASYLQLLQAATRQLISLS